MKQLHFQELAYKVWKKELFVFLKNDENPASKQKLNEYWTEYSSHLKPNTFCYLFSYKRHHFLKAKGLDIIDSKYDHEMAYSQMTNSSDGDRGFVNDYLEHIISEQRYLLAFVVRRAAVDLFIQQASFFSKHPNEYALFTEITIEDHKKRLWYTKQSYFPIYLENDDADMPYFCMAELVNESAGMPFKYRLDHINKLGDQKKVIELNEIFRKLIRKQMIRELNLTRRPLEYFSQYLIGKTPKDLETNNNGRISAQKNARNRTYKILKEGFPVLFSNHEPLDYKPAARLLYELGLI